MLGACRQTAQMKCHEKILTVIIQTTRPSTQSSARSRASRRPLATQPTSHRQSLASTNPARSTSSRTSSARSLSPTFTASPPPFFPRTTSTSQLFTALSIDTSSTPVPQIGWTTVAPNINQAAAATASNIPPSSSREYYTASTPEVAGAVVPAVVGAGVGGAAAAAGGVIAAGAGVFGGGGAAAGGGKLILH